MTNSRHITNSDLDASEQAAADIMLAALAPLSRAKRECVWAMLEAHSSIGRLFARGPSKDFAGIPAKVARRQRRTENRFRERELARAVRAAKAAGGERVVIDPASGKITVMVGKSDEASTTETENPFHTAPVDDPALKKRKKRR